MPDRKRKASALKRNTLRAIVTDSQLWVPLVVLVFGVTLLIYLG